MALTINIDGVDRAYAVRLVGGTASEGFHTEAAAMAGTVSSGLIEVEDPDGSLDLVGWTQFNIVEDTATPDRIATGWLANIDQTAGPFRVGPGRVHRCETVDLNWYLTRIALEQGTPKRPAETDLQRVTWLLGNASLNGRVYAGDLTDLTNNPVNLGEADYTDQFPIDVLTDICPVAGKTAYVTWDYTTARAQLFYDLTNTTTYDSPAAISDGAGDADGSTVFAWRNDPVLHRVIEDGFSDVWLRYTTGLVHKHDAAFQTAHARRDLFLGTSRIGNPATADAYATKALNAHNHETKSLDGEIEVDAAHVNDVLEGHRIYVKSTHLTGFTSYAYTRVERRTVRQVDDQSRRFIIGLQLSDRILSALPGGPPPATFPHTGGTSPGILQVDAGPGDRDFDDPIGEGHTLLYIGGGRNSPGFSAPTGYTAGPDGITAAFNNDKVGVFTKVAGSSESQHLDVASDLFQTGVWFELDGEYEIGTHNFGIGPSGSLETTPNTGSITAPAGALILAVASNGTDGGWGANTFTSPAGWTERLDDRVTPDHPSVWVGSQSAASAGSYNAQPVCTSAGWWAAQIVSVVGSAADSPPASGEEVPREIPTLDPDGVPTTYRTAHAFANESLHVWVDNTEQTAAVKSYDGACGEFTLGFEPTPTELVEVRYQGL